MDSSLALCFSAAILLVASSISLSSAVDNATLATICSQTQDKEACLKILHSDPRTTSADLPTLSLIAIDLTMKQADYNHKAYSDLHNNSTNPMLKKDFNKCQGLYGEMVGVIKGALQLSKQKKYKDTITQFAHLQMLATQCASGIPLDCLAIYRINQSMRLKIDISDCIIQYLATSRL